jgi:hypothetical protein
MTWAGAKCMLREAWFTVALKQREGEASNADVIRLKRFVIQHEALRDCRGKSLPER